jgi:hypothetical protein
MANTEKLGAVSENSSTWGDAFTFRDSHFVGHDGFIVPNCFSEFYQRFPTYVSDWVRKRVQGCVSATEAEDWTQELLLHLAALPLCSIHRANGKEDVIQTFAPERMHGANEARFRSFINQCLTNRFNTLYAKWRSRPLSNPRNLPFEVGAEFGASDEFCHSNSTYLRQAECRSREREEQRFRIEEFVRFGEASIPGLKVALEAFHRTGNWGQTETTFRVGRRQSVSLQRRVRELGASLVHRQWGERS